MLQTLKNAWSVAEIRKKFLFTLFIVLIFRFGSSIPVPFINVSALGNVFEGLQGTLLGYFDILSGGGLSSATLFAMSISPYINASIIIQLLTVAIPALERLAKDGGEEGRKKITKITKYTALAIGLVQAFGYYVLLKSQGTIVRTDAWSAVVIVLTFTAGTAILMWLSDRITEKGLGNGTSIILFAGIVSSLPGIINKVMKMFTISSNFAKTNFNSLIIAVTAIFAILVVVAFILTIGFVVIMNTAERKIPVHYAKRVVGRKMLGGQNTHLPIKVSASGVMPIIFASSIVSLPGTFTQLFGSGSSDTLWGKFVNIMQPTSIFYIVIFFMFIIGFSYFYAAMQFNPIEIANNLKKNGGFIPGFRPGKPTTDFLSRVLSKITFVGAIFLGLLATSPLIYGAVVSFMNNAKFFPTLANTLYLPYAQSISFGGTSVVIMVSVALETMRQLESQMMMKHYKGFLE